MSGIGPDVICAVLGKVDSYQKYKPLFVNGFLDEKPQNVNFQL